MRLAIVTDCHRTFSLMQDAICRSGHDLVWLNRDGLQHVSQHRTELDRIDFVLIVNSGDRLLPRWDRLLPEGQVSSAPSFRISMRSESAYENAVHIATTALPRKYQQHPKSYVQISQSSDSGAPEKNRLPENTEHRFCQGLTDRLTRRQIDIVSLVVQGKTNKQIARELGLSNYTVRNHLASVFKLLGASTRTQVGLLARALMPME